MSTLVKTIYRYAIYHSGVIEIYVPKDNTGMRKFMTAREIKHHNENQFLVDITVLFKQNTKQNRNDSSASRHKLNKL